MSSAQSMRPIYLFDNPRTCSQLLHRMFSSHPQLDAAKGYQWVTAAATSGPERMQLRVKSGDRAKAADNDLQQQVKAVFGPLGMDIENETYSVAAERLRSTIAASRSEDEKILLIKEHVSCCLKPEVMAELLRTGHIARPPANLTAIPDDIFANIKRPVFLVRHPARVIPSQWRAQQVHFGHDANDEGFRFFTMQRSTRVLFDQMRDKDPVVVDADDVVYRSEALCGKLCEIWAIDPSGVRYTWDKVSLDSGVQHPGASYYFGTLNNSTAPIRSVPEAIDMEGEFANWKLEYGAEVADALRGRVKADMEDYEYLQRFRIHI